MAFASMFIFPFLVMSIIILLIYIILKITCYIFQSIGLYKISKIKGYKYPFIAWIPCISQYIIGKFNKNSKFGVLYSILTIIKYLAIIAIFCFDNLLYFFLVYLIIYYIFDILTMDMFYTKIFKKSNLYTIITFFTFGFAKPIFIFMANYKIKNNNNV